MEKKGGSFGDSDVSDSVLFATGDLNETAASRHWKIDERRLHTVIRSIRNTQLSIKVPSKGIQLSTILNKTQKQKENKHMIRKKKKGEGKRGEKNQ